MFRAVRDRCAESAKPAAWAAVDSAAPCMSNVQTCSSRRHKT